MSASTAHPWTTVLTELRAAMPQLGELTCRQIFDTLHSYADVDPTMLREATDRNLQIALTALASGRVPNPAELTGAAQTAYERFTAGVTIDQMLLAFRVSIGQIHAHFVDTAMACGVPAESVVEGSRILWGVGDAFTTRAVTTYRDLELDKQLADAERTQALVHNLLAGAGVDEAASAGLDIRRPHLAFVCRVDEATHADPVRQQLQRTASEPGAPALVTVSQGRCLGVAPRAPIAPDGLAVAVGPLVDLDEMPHSYRMASLAAEAAQGRQGVLGLPELTWRLAAADHPEVTDHLRARFVDPVLAEGAFGDEVLCAVRSWLRHGQGIPRAARALYIHPNTLRYRLQRFIEITGSDLEDPDQVMGLWWALEAPRPPAS